MVRLKIAGNLKPVAKTLEVKLKSCLQVGFTIQNRFSILLIDIYASLSVIR